MWQPLQPTKTIISVINTSLLLSSRKSFYVCVCVCVGALVLSLVPVYVQRPVIGSDLPLWLSSLFLKLGLSLNPDLSLGILLAGQQTSGCLPALGLQVCPIAPSFYMGAGDTNTGPDDCIPGSLPTEPSLFHQQSHILKPKQFTCQLIKSPCILGLCCFNFWPHELPSNAWEVTHNCYFEHG